jgi:hypothetical protein
MTSDSDGYHHANYSDTVTMGRVARRAGWAAVILALVGAVAAIWLVQPRPLSVSVVRTPSPSPSVSSRPDLPTSMTVQFKALGGTCTGNKRIAFLDGEAKLASRKVFVTSLRWIEVTGDGRDELYALVGCIPIDGTLIGYPSHYSVLESQADGTMREIAMLPGQLISVRGNLFHVDDYANAGEGDGPGGTVLLRWDGNTLYGSAPAGTHK